MDLRNFSMETRTLHWALATMIHSHMLRYAHCLVGRSHECKRPKDIVAALPQVSTPSFTLDACSAQLDDSVKQLAAKGLSRYAIDIDALIALKPTVIITQDQCSVCAVSSADLENASNELFGPRCALVSLKPVTFEDLQGNIRQIAAAIGCAGAGDRLLERLLQNCATVQKRVASGGAPPRRVACLQWLNPLMGAGFWVPEMVTMAGGTNCFGEPGGTTPQITLDDLAESQPEVIIAMVCGYTPKRALADMPLLEADPQWRALAAVKADRVFVAD
eukprot:gene7377-8788_t